MKKLSKIDESAWGDMRKRSSGEQIRKEDEFNPEYIDFGEGTSVVWATEALEIEGEVKFSFEDVKNYNNNGWRLPTVKEVQQIDFNRDNVRIYWVSGYNTLQFPEGKIKIHTDESGRGFHMWTKDRHEKWNNDAYTYGYDNSYTFNIDSTNIHINKCYVFLVKDKTY